MLDARDRHQKQIEEKLKLQIQRQKAVDEKRLQNLALKQISLEKKTAN